MRLNVFEKIVFAIACVGQVTWPIMLALQLS